VVATASRRSDSAQEAGLSNRSRMCQLPWRIAHRLMYILLQHAAINEIHCPNQKTDAEAAGLSQAINAIRCGQ